MGGSSSSLQALKAVNDKISLPKARALVFGGTSGIGQGIAMRLARAKVSVTIVGRDEKRGEAIVGEMKTVANAPEAQFDFMRCDASLVRNVEAFAQEYAKRHGDGIDFLVLSQGIGSMAGRTPTLEGIDVKLAIHYYCRMALIRALIPQLQLKPEPRVLSVLSGGVHKAYEEYKTDPALDTTFSLKNAANLAGFYQDIGLDSYSREFKNVGFVHISPGYVNTNWGTELPWYAKGPTRVLQPLADSPEKCAEFMCEALFNSAYKTGFHVLNQTATPVSTVSLHEQAREFVWQHTNDLLQKARNAPLPSSA